MKRYIKLAEEDKKWIERAFGISRVMVNYALGFDPKRGNSDLAKRIRVVAKQRGGLLAYDEIPACETIHDSRGVMRQEFDNGATLMIDKSNGLVWVRDRNGNVVREVKDCSIEQLYVEQEFAAAL